MTKPTTHSEQELRMRIGKLLRNHGLVCMNDKCKQTLNCDVDFELMLLIQSEREKVIEEIHQWAKEHNLCSDLVATSSLMRFLEKLAQKEESK